MFCRLRAMGAALVVGLLLLCTVSGEAADLKNAEPQKTTTPALQAATAPVLPPVPVLPTAIPVPDVASKSTEVASILQKITLGLASSSQIEQIRESMSVVGRHSEADLTATMNLLQRQPTITDLQAEQERWHRRESENTAWLTVMTKRSNELQQALERLIDLQKLWSVTLDESKASKAPEPIMQQIAQTLAAIKDAQIPLQERIATVLELQSRVADEVTKCDKVLTAIEQVQKEILVGALSKRSLPIWSSALWADSITEMPGGVRTTIASYQVDLGNYLNAYRWPRFWPFVLLLMIFLSARHQARRWDDDSPALRVFEYPFSASLTAVLFVATSPFFQGAPGTVREVLRLVALAPLIILIRPIVGSRWLPGLYLIGIMLALGVVRRAFGAQILIDQLCLVIQSLLGIAGSIWFLSKLDSSSQKAAASSGMSAKKAGAVIALVIMAAGLAAAATGYMRLARQLTPSVTALGFLTLELYATILILNGLAAFGLRIWPLRTLGMALHHRVMVERKIYRFLLLLAGAALVMRYLNVVGLLELVLSTGQSMLSAKFERGAFSISLGGVLEFILVIWAAYLLSAFIRFVLQEDIYPRIGIAKGKSYAVSSLLHYFILALGFTGAIAALGLDLTKLTVLTGAFGIGIGFGLQSIVNNFVSGLILLFERPIQVGDSVAIGDLMGKVRRIGIRASIVRTIKGADIIVPNSQLVSEKVTNWTLSDQLRRIDLQVGVNYGANPKDVIKVLKNAALANPNILKDPEPQALFMAYGDSSINFELRAWTDHFDDWPSIKSELAIAVYDAVYAAGMTFPFPQREVRLLRDLDSGTAAKDADSVHEA